MAGTLPVAARRVSHRRHHPRAAAFSAAAAQAHGRPAGSARPARPARPGCPATPGCPALLRPGTCRDDMVGHLLSLQRQQMPNHDTELRAGGPLTVTPAAADA